MHRNLSLVHHEAGLLIRLTLPLLFAQLSQTAMGFVDTVMAGRYAGIDLAAVAVGSSLFFPVFLFLAVLAHHDNGGLQRRNTGKDKV